MVAAIGLRITPVQTTQLGLPTQFSPTQGVKIANGAVAYSIAEYALFETAAALYVLATGKPDPRQAANNKSAAMTRPYTPAEAKLFADGLLVAMQKYPDAKQAPKGFLAKLEKWKDAAYKANEPNSSLQIFARLYIEDQKLITSLRNV
jgi:hypothetical protein